MAWCPTKGIQNGIPQSIFDELNKPSTKKCIYIEICPSATAWCNNNQPNEACIPFLDNAENKLMSKINTIGAIKNYINRK